MKISLLGLTGHKGFPVARLKKFISETAIIAMAAYLSFYAFTNFVPYSLVWNNTPSIPEGLYLAERVSPGMGFSRGELGCFKYEPPAWAVSRDYAIPGIHLCKHVLGFPGDTLDQTGKHLVVRYEENGIQKNLNAGEFTRVDSKGRTVPDALAGVAVIPPGYFFMEAPAHDNSLDSRYLGLIPIAKVNLKAYPIFTY